jgi:hypothetical protein
MSAWAALLLSLLGSVAFATGDPAAVADPTKREDPASVSGTEDFECFGIRRTENDDKMDALSKKYEERRTQRENGTKGQQ